MALIRKDQFNVTLSIDGKSYGVWDKHDGGEIDSSEKKYKPGGMGKEQSLGGTKTTGNITLERAYDLQRDGSILAELKAKAGKGVATVTKQPLDADGIAFGPQEVEVGTLKRVTPPSHDSNSTDEATIQVEVSSVTTN